jgi:hypothetical protein
LKFPYNSVSVEGIFFQVVPLSDSKIIFVNGAIYKRLAPTLEAVNPVILALALFGMDVKTLGNVTVERQNDAVPEAKVHDAVPHCSRLAGLLQPAIAVVEAGLAMPMVPLTMSPKRIIANRNRTVNGFK